VHAASRRLVIYRPGRELYAPLILHQGQDEMSPPSEHHGRDDTGPAAEESQASQALVSFLDWAHGHAQTRVSPRSRSFRPGGPRCDPADRAWRASTCRSGTITAARDSSPRASVSRRWRGAVHQRQHGQRARQQHLAQARRPRPGPGRRPGRTRRPAGPRATLNAVRSPGWPRARQASARSAPGGQRAARPRKRPRRQDHPSSEPRPHGPGRGARQPCEAR
jgi:hypothetical protein